MAMTTFGHSLFFVAQGLSSSQIINQEGFFCNAKFRWAPPYQTRAIRTILRYTHYIRYLPWQICSVLSASERSATLAGNENAASVLDTDIGSFIEIKRNVNHLYLKLTLLQQDFENEAIGYIQYFELPIDKIYDILGSQSIHHVEYAQIEKEKAQLISDDFDLLWLFYYICESFIFGILNCIAVRAANNIYCIIIGKRIVSYLSDAVWN